MWRSLIEIDQAWLVAINGWHSAWADEAMWLISGRWTWLPLYALLVGLLIWRFGWRRALVMLLFFGMAVGLADYVSSGLIKPWVCRLRPTHNPNIMNTLHIVHDYRGGQFGFVSSHAANTMACALLFCLLWNTKDDSTNVKSSCKQWSWLLMIWVALNCYSRMYLGVHYPGDILGGLIVGALMALAAFAVHQVVEAACVRALLRVHAKASDQQAAGDDGDRG